MSSAERLREFVKERLSAAAEEIFRVFKQTIVEYEEEIDRQRRLLDVVWKPEIKLHRIELPQQHVCKEEVLADQQLCIQERNSSLHREDSEPPQIKEEQEDLWTSQEGEQLVLKEETETFMLTPTDEESDHSEDQTLNLNPDKFLIATEKGSVVNMLVTLASDPKGDHHFPTHNSQLTKSQDQKGGEHEYPGLTRSRLPEEKSQHHEGRSHSSNVCSSAMSDILCNTYTGQESLKCGACEKGFESKSRLQKHLRIHTGERPYICKTCGKTFRFRSNLTVHIRVHTGEKPYHCNTCGKRFTDSSTMKRHLTVHTDEKPYSCKVCGKMYRQSSTLRDHMRIHTEGSCTFARHEENQSSKCMIWKGHQNLI